jgi:hypothetical protein
MATKTDITMHGLLAGAFHALVRGDTAERERLCAQAQKASGAARASLSTNWSGLGLCSKTRNTTWRWP